MLFKRSSQAFIEKHKNVVAIFNFFNLQKMVSFQQGFQAGKSKVERLRQDCMAMADVDCSFYQLSGETDRMEGMRHFLKWIKVYIYASRNLVSNKV